MIITHPVHSVFFLFFRLVFSVSKAVTKMFLSMCVSPVKRCREEKQKRSEKEPLSNECPSLNVSDLIQNTFAVQPQPVTVTGAPFVHGLKFQLHDVEFALHVITHRNKTLLERDKKIVWTHMREGFSAETVHIWCFLRNYTSKGQILRVGWQTSPCGLHYLCVSGVQCHPDRLLTAIELVSNQTQPICRDTPGRQQNTMGELVEKLIQNASETDKLLETAKRLSEENKHTIQTLRNLLLVSQTCSKDETNVPLAENTRIASLRNHMQEVWNCILSEGEKVTVASTCVRLVEHFPHTYRQNFTENNLKSRLNYYRTTFTKEYKLYKDMRTQFE